MASFFAPFAKFTVIHIYSFASFGRVVCWFGTAAQCVSAGLGVGLSLLLLRYAPQRWLCAACVQKANQTDIALNAVSILSPYLEMFTSPRRLTEVGRRGCESFWLDKAF